MPCFCQFDFSNWFRGIIAAFVQGGAAAVGSGVAVIVTDPQHGMVSLNLLKIAGTTFIVSGTLGMFSFLAKVPVPPLKTVETTTTTVAPPNDWDKTATVVTTRETHQEPISKQGDPK